MAGPPVALYVIGMVMFGCLNTETTKIQFTMSSTGLDGNEKLFHKPWQAVFTMFCSMSLVLIYHFIAERWATKRAPDYVDLREPLAGEDSVAASGLRRFLIIGAPALFDLLGTGCSMIGFVYLSASISQMLRGSTIVISACLTVPMLGRRLMGYNWIGVLLCTVGISLVGLSNMLNAKDDSDVTVSSPAEQAFGMFMNLFGQIFSSLQYISEEKLLKDINVPAMLVVGYEGIWGVLMMIFVVFPLLYVLPGNDQGSVENVHDTWVMIANNPSLLILIGIYLFSVSTYNVAGMLVTGALSGVHRTMLEASRTMVIWGINLGAFYFISPTPGWAEKWTLMSWVQLAGFTCVIVGQMIYGAVLKVPGMTYPMEMTLVSPQSPASFLNSPGFIDVDIEDIE